MTERFEPGEAVEVHSVWAASNGYGPPLSHWFSGYTVAVDDGGALVQVTHDSGLFEGCVVNIARGDVRRRMYGPRAPECWQKRWPWQDLEYPIEALARVEALMKRAKNS